jgi:hypothetical protein
LHAINLARKRCIHGLNLVELDVTDNKKITNVSMMKSLKILNASGFECGIDQNGVIGLDLVGFVFHENEKLHETHFSNTLY